MNCKICKGSTKPVFDFKVKVLNKHLIDYLKCNQCGFIQTEDPYWLPEAYSSAITSLDIGLIGRNIKTSKLVSSLILGVFDKNGKFLDYGGGYGMLVRMMRDLGFDFYRFDTYCENTFATHFDLGDSGVTRFELLTAFELFEHLADPVGETGKMLELSDSIFFSTELVPDRPISQPDDWWYFTPETGQHIALYSAASLQKLASIYGCNFYTNGSTFHLITRKKLSPIVFKLLLKKKVSSSISSLFSRKSLLMTDFDNIKTMLNQNN